MTYHDYLIKIKRNRKIILLFQLLITCLIIIIWQLLTDLNIIDSFIISSPKNILNTIITLYKENNLFIHILTTINEVIISFSITTILSIVLALILYNYNTLYKIFDPFITLINSLPKVALGPLFIIWIGSNIKSVITISVLISLIVSLQTILNGFQNTDKLKIKLLKTFNASKLDILINVVLKENKSVILNTLKINISMCLIGLITGEFLTSKSGLGYLILYGTQVFDLNLVMSSLFILLIISFILYKIVILLIKKYLREKDNLSLEEKKEI